METVANQDMEALYRAAVGAKKAEFYAPKFLRFDQPGATKRSWNWPAFFVAFYWFLFRRMYAYCAIYCILIPVALAIVFSIVISFFGARASNLFYVVSFGYSYLLIPLYANSLYHRSIRQRIEALRLKVPETKSQLLVLDSTSPTTGIVWVIIPFVLVALVGILAAIAIPAYQSYVIRAQVSEGIMLMDQAKSAVVTSYMATKSWPADASSLTFTRPMRGRYVRELIVDRGTITASYGNQANSLISGHRLSVRPALGEHGAVLWTCGYAGPTGDDPESGSAASGATDIKPQFLPSSCR